MGIPVKQVKVMTEKEQVFWHLLGWLWIVVCEIAEEDRWWWASKTLCKCCGDIATEGGGIGARFRYCQDCWDEITGKDNGMKFLERRGLSRAGIRLGSDSAGGGPSGRFGHRVHNDNDNAVRALEEDR